MTTIAWDGKELVSDSRVTRELVGVSDTASFEDNFHLKLVPGHGFLIMGQQVQALGFSGDVCSLRELVRLGESAFNYGLRLELNTLAPETITPGTPLSMFNYDLLVITEEAIFVVTVRPASNTFTIIQGVRTAFATIGSSYRHTEALLHVCDDARALVTYASIFDRYTGGNYNIWDGTTFRTNVSRMSKFRAFLRVFTGSFRIAYKKCASEKEAPTT